MFLGMVVCFFLFFLGGADFLRHIEASCVAEKATIPGIGLEVEHRIETSCTEKTAF